MNILLIHPDGNINENANLWDLVLILCERGHTVDIASPRNRPHQLSPCAGARLLAYPLDYSGLTEPGPIPGPIAALPAAAPPAGLRDSYHWVVGVDFGLLTASVLAAMLGARLGFISYEITFEAEVGPETKEIERLACAAAEFAVCQDPVRSAHLAREYRIPAQRIIEIPVSGRGPALPGRDEALRRRLGLHPDTKILLFLGSVSRWTMADGLLEAAADLPADWRLVIHNRYGLTGFAAELAGRAGADKVVFSRECYATMYELTSLLHGADLGAVMYAASRDNMNTGQNIADIGLASGKFSLMMRHGLPVLVNEVGAISQAVREHGLGLVVHGPEAVGAALAGLDGRELAAMRPNCTRYFEERLDLDRHVGPLLALLESGPPVAAPGLGGTDRAFLLLEAQRAYLVRQTNRQALALRQPGPG